MEALINKRVAVIGAGNIGKMLLERMRKMGVPADLMLVCDSDPERAKSAAAPVGASVFDLTDPTGCEADVWLLCPGPKALLPVLQRLASRLRSGQVVVSFAAAVPMAKLEALIAEGVSLVRVMPNMPSLVGRGMNPVCFSEKAAPEARALVLELLDSLGKTIEVRDDQMNWCVGLTGAAMRSVLPAIEGMIRAGIEAGLSEADARLIAAQVVIGTAGLVKHTSLSLTEIKNLTPMETLDEVLIERLVYEAAAGAKKKIDSLQEKIVQE
jgi:pyrroline-5-carboxylate reductase